MNRCVMSGLLALLLVVFAHAPAGAEASKKVNCVYPGEALSSALTDLATQLGYEFNPADYEDSLDLDESIWVLAKDVEPEMAARMIGASGGIRVNLDAHNRRITLADPEDEVIAAPRVRGFDAAPHCKQYLEYQNKYGRKGAAEPNQLYQPTATEELRDAVGEILRLEETEGGAGSAIGKRLVYTRSSIELDQIAELLHLLDAAGGGESNALSVDRKNRETLRKLHSTFQPADGLLSALLYQLFKDCTAPVYVDSSIMSGLDLQYDSTEITLHEDESHYDALQALAREQYWTVDSVGGALRLNQQDYEGGASYRVFDAGQLLADLDKQYAELKTEYDVQDGFHGDLRSQGGIEVISDALELQLEAAGHSPLIRTFGSRLVVVGGVDVMDSAVEVLQAMGWKESEGEQK